MNGMFGKSNFGLNRGDRYLRHLLSLIIIILVWSFFICSTATARLGTPAAVISSTDINFGSLTVGTLSGPQSIILTNSGNATLTISSIKLSGRNPGDFIQTSTCGKSLAAGVNCSIQVIFKPSATGSRTATLTITDNAKTIQQKVSFSGTGAAAACAANLSTSSLAFASQPVSIAAAPQSVTISNNGNAALSVTSVSVSGTNASDFTQTNSCGSSVAAGSSCTISVTFTPAAAGTRSATLSIADSATGSPQSVSLFGTGAAAGASVSPPSAAFGSLSVGTASSAQSITVNNTGNATLSVTSVSVAGTNASDFTQTNGCGSSVAAGTSCTISVTFKPAAAGTRSRHPQRGRHRHRQPADRQPLWHGRGGSGRVSPPPPWLSAVYPWERSVPLSP